MEGDVYVRGRWVGHTVDMFAPTMSRYTKDAAAKAQCV